MSEHYQASAKGMMVNDDLDQMVRGEPFEVIWSFINEGTAVWNGGVQLVYAGNHADAVDYPHTNLAAGEALTLTELDVIHAVQPGDTVYLTVPLRSPEEPGMYYTAFQLQDPDGQGFGPLRELRVIVVPPAHKGLGDPAYEFVGATNNIQSKNSTPAGLKFTATWTLRNTSTEPMTAGYGVAYFGEDPGPANFIPHQMGAKDRYSLAEVSGKNLVQPDEQVHINFELQAPEEPGFYRFRWQMLDEAGNAFGGVRYMSFIVADAGGAPPPEPVETRPFTPPSISVSYFTGIHGPASDWVWGDNQFQDMMRRLNMPVFFMSGGSNLDMRGFGDPNKNIVRIVWNPNTRDPNQAYEEIKKDMLPKWYGHGYRRFVFFNEPQFNKAIAGIEEGMGISWDNAVQFADFLKVILTRARQDFPEIKLYNTPISTAPGQNYWFWREEMWKRVKHLLSGWCMHAYSDKETNAELAAQEIANQVIELQRRLQLRIPVVVSEASVNRGNNPAVKARTAIKVAERLSKVRGVEGVFWYAADWDVGMDKNHEGWYRNGIADEYFKQAGL